MYNLLEYSKITKKKEAVCGIITEMNQVIFFLLILNLPNARQVLRVMIRTYTQIQYTHKDLQHSSIIWPVWLNGWVFFYVLSGCGFESSCSHLNLRFRNCFQQGVLCIQVTIECGFNLKCVRDMIRIYSQTHLTDKFSQHSSIIWPVWVNGWLFIYELSGCGFEFSCSHFNFGL